ncbi:hypothetical protein J4573_36120 [Actinomadura barringtoniae]|uniref:XRE family transcriptional regulator n=1 Tax=Actinomadura barringtoniae TaxID=1427535 RepID=A0A939PH61_9ACTN|nr:hypothetical protein [Actinomadura barringtoniae]MBO2452565.1 hypothetical protein [Actinomadura barringtoniae]
MATEREEGDTSGHEIHIECRKIVVPVPTELPAWAIRLRNERRSRLWSQKTMATMLRNAADDETRPSLPSLASIQRYVRAYEASDHCPGELYATLYCRAFGMSHEALFGDDRADPVGLPTEHDAESLGAWIATTNVSSEGLLHLADAAGALAENHSRRPPIQVLADVTLLHDRVQKLLRSGRQRLWQTHELLRIDSDLLSHACLLLGDLERDGSAKAFGRVARQLAQEAGANEARAMSAQAKTARWMGCLTESADLAAEGFRRSPPTSIRILLAYQEANAAALSGDAARARQAIGRAEHAAASAGEDDSISAWSCPVSRQAVFAISVALRNGDPDVALRGVAMADMSWSDAPSPPSTRTTWAQIRIGAGIAYVMKGALDSAAAEIAPMLTLAPEYRIATVTRYLAQLDQRLSQRRFLHSREARDIQGRLHEFKAAALPLHVTEDK